MKDDYMDIYETNPQGYWKAGDKKFLNKFQALQYASDTKVNVTFHYFDNVFEKFDRSYLGKFTLDELYKQRALQLREKYDYLILYFSGGADSYNVVRSFLDNNIKLDEICVKWPKKILNANVSIYTPNILDTSAFNYISEWDFAIKPVLEEIAQSHPGIKIEIVDWLPDENVNLEKYFETVQHWHDIELPSLAVWSPSEERLINQGKRVGSIYGVDKPNVRFDKNSALMLFNDSTLAMGTSNPCNIYGTEFFYWTPDFPVLAFEMANQVTQWYFNKPHYVNMYGWRDENFYSMVPGTMTYIMQQKLYRNVLYSTWTNRFQADKSLKGERTDKQNWILKVPELQRYREQFISIKDDYVKDLHRLAITIDRGRPMYYGCFTMSHKIVEHKLKELL
jgi:hypothetical protein